VLRCPKTSLAFSLRRRLGLRRGGRLLLQRRPVLRSGPLQPGRSRLNAGLLLQALPVRRARLLRRSLRVLSGPLQFILPLRRILPLLLTLRVGAAQRALLGDDLTADGLRGMGRVGGRPVR